jgi:pilus assembly protein CpaB
LLSRVRVLKYGADSIDKAAVPSSAPAAREAARTAVLAVPVEDVDRLLLGSQNGKLTLALRHPADPGVADVALFPNPAGVLAGRADLTAEQREQLRSPGDRAFAGLDMNALAGDAQESATPTTVAKSPVTPSRTAVVRRGGVGGGRSIEVIRGTSREDTSL